MEALRQQVKMDILRTLIWTFLSLGVGIAAFYFVL